MSYVQQQQKEAAKVVPGQRYLHSLHNESVTSQMIQKALPRQVAAN